jgi:hypothetical protein
VRWFNAEVTTVRTQITIMAGFIGHTFIAQSYARIGIVARLSARFAESGSVCAHASTPNTAIIEAVDFIDAFIHGPI